MFSDNYSVQLILLSVLAILNLLSYFLFYSDKRKAKNHQQRISENTLLFVAFFFGGLGAWLSMQQFRHKTKQWKFKLLVPVALMVTVGTIYIVLAIR